MPNLEPSVDHSPAFYFGPLHECACRHVCIERGREKKPKLKKKKDRRERERERDLRGS